MYTLERYAPNYHRSLWMIKIQGRKDQKMIKTIHIDDDQVYFYSIYQEQLRCFIDEFKEKSAVVVHPTIQDSINAYQEAKVAYALLQENQPIIQDTPLTQDKWEQKRSDDKKFDQQSQYIASLQEAKMKLDKCFIELDGLQDEYLKQLNAVITHYNSQLACYYQYASKTMNAKIDYFPLVKKEDLNDMFHIDMKGSEA